MLERLRMQERTHRKFAYAFVTTIRTRIGYYVGGPGGFEPTTPGLVDRDSIQTELRGQRTRSPTSAAVFVSTLPRMQPVAKLCNIAART